MTLLAPNPGSTVSSHGVRLHKASSQHAMRADAAAEGELALLPQATEGQGGHRGPLGLQGQARISQLLASVLEPLSSSNPPRPSHVGADCFLEVRPCLLRVWWSVDLSRLELRKW